MAKKLKKEVIRAYALKNAVEHKGKAILGSVIPGLFAEGLEKKDIRAIGPKIGVIINEVNHLGLEVQKLEFAKVEKLIGHRPERDPNELPKLPSAVKGKVIMRFRPAPSGPLHVGHIISNMISSLFVKHYGGKFYVIIDDTNPEEILKQAYDKHKKDCNWIFGNVVKYINSSDNMKSYYSYGEELIKKEYAYVCTCKKESFKKLRDNKEECKCRKLSVEDNVLRWNKMLEKGKLGYKEEQAVLRFKSDIKDPNPAMRDFPLARINTTEHPRVGKRYKVWPLMNLVVAVDDIELGMTHVIRGKDHADNAKRQKMIFKALRKEKQFPWNFFIGRMKFKDLVLSKRKIEALIKEGKYSGWDDPNLPTIAGLKKKGYKKEAFAKLAVQRGLTDVDKVISKKDFFEVLDRFNLEVSVGKKVKQKK